jgi:hypothetical protein
MKASEMGLCRDQSVHARTGNRDAAMSILYPHPACPIQGLLKSKIGDRNLAIQRLLKSKTGNPKASQIENRQSKIGITKNPQP